MRSAVLVVAGACAFRAGTTGSPPAPDGAGADGHAMAPPDAPPDAPPAPFALSGLHWLLPCTSGDLGNYNCNCAAGNQDQDATVAGTGSWTVTVQIRGVMEAIGYGGGSAGSGGWYIGGNPGDTADNYYELIVSSPAQHFYLNLGTPTAQRSFDYDYMATIAVDGGAQVTFRANGQDGLEWGNYDESHDPIVISGVTTNPSPYVGQFAQLDVIDATPM